MENTNCVYYANKKVTTQISEIETYNYVGVVYFKNNDRTIMLEQGEYNGIKYGLTCEDVIKVLKEKGIIYELK